MLRNTSVAAVLLLAACQRTAPADLRPGERLSPVAAMVRASADGFARAVAPRPLLFPRDHGPHPDFMLEWWYFTGNLQTEGGRRFGFQLTFFRQALAPRAPRRPSAWATSQLYMAHFALTDVGGGRFFSRERTARGAAGLAGGRGEPFAVWLEDWSARSTGDGFLPLRLTARSGDAALDLVLTSAKPLVLQGDEGWSRKGSEAGAASYYYSYTRMPGRGTVRAGGRSFAVHGLAWLDREWSTRVLDESQVGWDWLALQLDDGRDLMFFRVRRRDGTVEPLSHGSLVAPDGGKRPLGLADVELEVLRTWSSPRGTVYPAGWRLRIAREALDLEIEPLLADQELDVSFRYWEGAVRVRGSGAAEGVTGRGYVELVGY